jgi:hypothetical protein
MKITKILISLAVLVLPVVAIAQPVSAASRISGINIQSACDNQYGRGTTAELYGKTVINWNCRYTVGGHIMSRLNVDLNRECRRIYGRSAYAAYTNYYNPYSWGCYR